MQSRSFAQSRGTEDLVDADAASCEVGTRGGADASCEADAMDAAALLAVSARGGAADAPSCEVDVVGAVDAVDASCAVDEADAVVFGYRARLGVAAVALD